MIKPPNYGFFFLILVHSFDTQYFFLLFLFKYRCRYGASELHSIAAFMGGMLAQETIKIITGQFVPFNNTLIYNGMKQSTITVEL